MHVTIYYLILIVINEEASYILIGLTITRVLTVTKARITQLDADNLSSLSNLEELDLDGNDLTAFNATAFEVRSPF